MVAADGRDGGAAVVVIFTRHLSVYLGVLLLKDAKAAVRRGCSLANDLAGRVNDAKGRIDSARAQLQHQERQQQRRRPDEQRREEEREEEESVKRVLLSQLKRRKRDYRRLFEKLAEAKADVRNLQQNKHKVNL